MVMKHLENEKQRLKNHCQIYADIAVVHSTIRLGKRKTSAQISAALNGGKKPEEKNNPMLDFRLDILDEESDECL